MNRLEKMLATKAATQARRATQILRVRELKIVDSALRPSQREALARIFLEAKWLRNSALGHGIFEYSLKEHGLSVLLPNGELEERKLIALPGHVKQTVLKQLQAEAKALATRKRNG